MKTLACSIWAMLVVMAPVAANGDIRVPSSLRMRPRAQPASHAPPLHAGKRVAQAATPDQPASNGSSPPDGEAGATQPGDAAGAPPAAEPAQPIPERAPAPEPDAAPAPTPDAAPAPTPDAAPNTLAEPVAPRQRFTVTGSLIERTTLTTPAPLTILHREDLIASGRATLGDILEQLPAQANAIDPGAANGGDGWGRVDLRGLGSNRTLLLLNGRRLVAGATGAAGSVDVNAIPLAVVERVEILKAGASAVYGSDAIGGVVNLITRDDFEGTEAALYTAASQHDDGFMYDASFVTGHRSDDRKGTIMFSAGIQHQDPVFAGDRLFSRYDVDFGFEALRPNTGRFVSPTRGRIDAFNIDTDGDGKPDTINLCGDGVQYCTSNGNGTYRPFDPLNDQSRQQVDYLRTPSPRYSAYSAGTYKLSPEVAGFFEASYLRRTSDHQAAREPFSTLWSGIGISRDSVYNQTGGDVNGYDRSLEELGPVRSRQRIGTLRTVAGLRGAIPEDAPAFQRWKWEVSYDYGRSDGTNVNASDVSASRLANALGPSFRDASGVPTCGTPTAPIPGCVPMNLLGPPGSIDAGARDHVAFSGTSRGFDEQQTVLATTHGRIAKLPHHGDLSASVGTDFRKEAAGFTPTGDSLGELQVPGKASYHVLEGFGELALIPISGERLAESVELDLAARGFHSDSFGSGITWNAGGLFRPVPSFAVRATYATAFRAPSAGEIFQHHTGSGNRDLEPETAKVLTAGVVFEPPRIQGLSLTADYWHIDVTKAIQPTSASVVLSNCYTLGLQEYCDQIQRDPGGGLTIGVIDDPLAHLGDTSTSGLDTAVGYDRTFGGVGRFHEQLEAQVLFTYDLDGTQHSRGSYDFAVDPMIKASLSSAWQHPSGVGAGLNLRYVGSFTQCFVGDCFRGPDLRRAEADAWYKVDLFGSYTRKTSAGSTTLAIGVNNLLDRNPSLLYLGSGGGPSSYVDYLAASSSDVSTYDHVGRFVYARLSHRF